MRDGLIRALQYMIAAYDVDGFRIERNRAGVDRDGTGTGDAGVREALWGKPNAFDCGGRW